MSEQPIHYLLDGELVCRPGEFVAESRRWTTSERHVTCSLCRVAAAVIEGVLYDHFETGTEGVVWSVQEDGKQGYDGLHHIEEGDTLTIFHPGGMSTLWRGVIKPDRKVGFRPFPLNPQYGQQVSCGRWVHWIQEGFDPGEWGRFFFDHDPPLRAELMKAPVRAKQFMGPQSVGSET